VCRFVRRDTIRSLTAGKVSGLVSSNLADAGNLADEARRRDDLQQNIKRHGHMPNGSSSD
jgi:hypothetical protein